MKDLIIGGASNYSWSDLQYWVNSIKKTGFEGDVVLVGSNMTKLTMDKLSTQGIKLSLFGKVDENGNVMSEGNMPPHVERFFYLWDFLDKNPQEYNNIIVTDTRDVVFQSNPSDWLEKKLMMYSIIASSEGMRYKNEPWGNTNLYQSFGPHFHNILKNNYIYNVGVIAGSYNEVKSLMSMIFQLSLNRPIPIVDQAVYNYLLSLPVFYNNTFFSEATDSWGINLGTTIEAVKAGSGDLGRMVAANTIKLKEYEMAYEDKQPVILDDGTVTNQMHDKYVVVHQWDRVPGLAEKVKSLYGDPDKEHIFYHPV